MISRKPNDSIEKGFVPDCYTKENRSEEVIGVIDHTVVVVANVVVKVVEIELDIGWEG